MCGMDMVPARGSEVASVGRIDHWTCPMPEHSEVESSAPGRCPKCGMFLEQVEGEPEAPMPEGMDHGADE